jgi:hypothetical protein
MLHFECYYFEPNAVADDAGGCQQGRSFAWKPCFAVESKSLARSLSRPMSDAKFEKSPDANHSCASLGIGAGYSEPQF